MNILYITKVSDVFRPKKFPVEGNEDEHRMHLPHAAFSDKPKTAEVEFRTGLSVFEV